MPQFQVDLPIWATAYIEAASAEEARAMVASIHLTTVSMEKFGLEDDSMELSPVATVYTKPGTFGDGTVTVPDEPEPENEAAEEEAA